jgi:hypothetical protein
METTKYNGWTNYATWRINLEWFDYDHYEKVTPEQLQEIVEDGLYEQSNGTLVYDYAMAFIDDVNWNEISECINADITGDED